MKIVSFLCILALASLAEAQPWTPNVIWSREGTGDSSLYGEAILALGDQNGDGYNDWAVYAYGWGPPGQICEAKVEFFHGGSPPDTEPYMVRVTDPLTERSMGSAKVLGDLNGDRYIDWSVTVNSVRDTVNHYCEIYFGGPGPHDQPDLLLILPVFSSFSGIGDFNGDGYDDLLFTNSWVDTSCVYFGGNPMDTIPDWFRHHVIFDRSPYSVDLNADAFDDIVSGFVNAEDTVEVYWGGAHPDTSPAYTWSGMPSPWPVRDFNGDEYDDFAHLWQGHIAMHYGGPALRVEPDRLLDAWTVGEYRLVSVGDINRDGFNDLIEVSYGGGSAAALYLGWPYPNPQAVWVSAGGPPVNVPAFKSAVGLGDVNGDGYQDWDIWWHYLAEPDSWAVQVYFGGPSADTIPAFSLSILVGEGLVGSTGDFNGDHVGDLYRYFRQGDSCQIFYGGAAPDIIPDWTLTSPPGHQYESLPQSFGDVNGDGYADFVNGSPNEGITYVFVGGANPDTVPVVTWNGFWTAPSEIIKDMNRDGRDELAFATPGGHADIHLGRDVPSQTPDFTLNFDPDCMPFRMTTAGDFNHDGYNDLVVVDDACNNLWGTLSLYLGHPWINPDPALTIQGRSGDLNLIGINNAAGLGDVNGDGIEDFAVGAFNTNFDGRRGRVVIISGDSTWHVAADEPRVEFPHDLKVSIYPNPFNSEATVLLDLPAHSSRVCVTLYNLLGQEVRRADLGNVVGTTRYDLNSGGLSSGIYLLQVQAGSLTNTQNLVVMK
jgi:hypothetical protein